MENQICAKILVVEDDEIAQYAARFLLEKTGCSVDIATTGGEALKLLDEKKYVLVFLDLGLSDYSDFTLVKLVREKMGPNFPIVVLTAHTRESFRDGSYKAGCSDYLPKPLTSRSCKEILDKYLPEK
jgi:two-component system, OmpR family, aerobic respiration control sensor histidine kinase ArcB